MTKPLLVHVFTDGHPTNDQGCEDIYSFGNMLKNRPNIYRTFVSIILCTDDEEIERPYRQLEYNPGTHLSKNLFEK